jgi:hypothetical protein
MVKTHIPTVKFLMPSIPREVGVLTYFLTPDLASNNWRNVVFNRHPELEEMVIGLTDKDEINKQCLWYVKKYRREHEADFEKSLKENEKLWKTIEKEYLETLSEHFEISYPRHRKVMKAYVSIIPIYPRYLSDWSFNVSHFVPDRVKEIACHEIQHFMYFKKWLEVFPETKFEEFNHPHLVWRLSELIAPVILNEYPEFKKLFTRKQQTYKHFQKIRIKGKQPTTHLALIYRRHLKSGNSFDEFLKEIWQFAKENEEFLTTT